MSQHSYSRCWLHLIWATLNRESMLDQAAAARLSKFLYEYAESKSIYLKINFVNSDHVHTLIDLPTACTIESAAQWFKGASSRWIGEQKLLRGHFYWGRGYGVFSVSQSHVDRVCKYIARQPEHHRKRSFLEEYEMFVRRHGLKWHDDAKNLINPSLQGGGDHGARTMSGLTPP
jgi:putative transposase